MSPTVNYATPLRALGQALELLNIGAFDMEVEKENFIIRGKFLTSPFTNGEQPMESIVREIWGSMPQGVTLRAISLEASGNAPAPLELTYTSEDVERLEWEGRQRRCDSAGMANTASMSQLLRAAGAYLTRKRARLLKLSRNEQSVTVHYRTAQGRGAEEVLPLSRLAEFAMEMYKNRSVGKGTSS